jgi:acyl-CoA thioester hydrolase
MIPHQSTCRVIYGDTDNMGMAYHANYLRWFEIGRTELFRSLGFTYKEIEAQGIFLPVSEIGCKYLRPVRYDDLLIIETTVDKTVRGGVKFHYIIWIESADSAPAARGWTLHACVTTDGKVVRPPGFLKEIISRCWSDPPDGSRTARHS